MSFRRPSIVRAAYGGGPFSQRRGDRIRLLHPAEMIGRRPQRDRVALLVHDMQRYFLAAFDAGNAPLRPVVDNIARLLAHCRAAQGVGIDRSPQAVAVAARNAEQLGLRPQARFREGDWHAAGLVGQLRSSQRRVRRPGGTAHHGQCCSKRCGPRGAAAAGFAAGFSSAT